MADELKDAAKRLRRNPNTKVPGTAAAGRIEIPTNNPSWMQSPTPATPAAPATPPPPVVTGAGKPLTLRAPIGAAPPVAPELQTPVGGNATNLGGKPAPVASTSSSLPYPTGGTAPNLANNTPAPIVKSQTAPVEVRTPTFAERMQRPTPAVKQIPANYNPLDGKAGKPLTLRAPIGQAPAAPVTTPKPTVRTRAGSSLGRLGSGLAVASTAMQMADQAGALKDVATGKKTGSEWVKEDYAPTVLPGASVGMGFNPLEVFNKSKDRAKQIIDNGGGVGAVIGDSVKNAFVEPLKQAYEGGKDIGRSVGDFFGGLTGAAAKSGGDPMPSEEQDAARRSSSYRIDQAPTQPSAAAQTYSPEAQATANGKVLEEQAKALKAAGATTPQVPAVGQAIPGTTPFQQEIADPTGNDNRTRYTVPGKGFLEGQRTNTTTPTGSALVDASNQARASGRSQGGFVGAATDAEAARAMQDRAIQSQNADFNIAQMNRTADLQRDARAAKLGIDRGTLDRMEGRGDTPAARQAAAMQQGSSAAEPVDPFSRPTDGNGDAAGRRSQYEGLINSANDSGLTAKQRATRLAVAEAMIAPGQEAAKLQNASAMNESDNATQDRATAAQRMNSQLDAESQAAQRRQTQQNADRQAGLQSDNQRLQQVKDQVKFNYDGEQDQIKRGESLSKESQQAGLDFLKSTQDNKGQGGVDPAKMVNFGRRLISAGGANVELINKKIPGLVDRINNGTPSYNDYHELNNISKAIQATDGSWNPFDSPDAAEGINRYFSGQE